MEELRILHDMEKRLMYLDKAFRDIVQNSNSFIVRWNKRGIQYMNPRALEFFGYTKEEVIGKDVRVLLPSPEVERKLSSLVDEIVRDPSKNIGSQNENVKKSGERVWIAWSNSAVSDEKGDVDIIAIGNDITELKTKEAALRTREKEFRALVDNSNSVVVRWDRQFRFLYANPRIEYIEGNPASSYIGKTISDLHLAGGEKLMETVSKAFETGREQCVEFALDTTNGKMILEQTIIPEFADGKVRTVMGVARDVTMEKNEQRLLESEKNVLGRKVDERTRQLGKAEYELERSKRLSELGQLAATVAHELRNPLAAIQMAAFNINRKIKDEKIAGNIATIEKKVEESNQIISDVLAYGRIKSPAYERIRFADLVRESVKDSRKKIEGCHARVEDKLASVEGLEADIDARQMKEVFLNLIDNACDAVKAVERRQGVVTIEGEDAGDSVRLSIIDNGVGMDDATLQKLLKPFFTTKSEGTGLGLTVAKQIVDLHKGSLSIRSEKDRGTSVTILIPKREE